MQNEPNVGGWTTPTIPSDIERSYALDEHNVCWMRTHNKISNTTVYERVVGGGFAYDQMLKKL